MSVQGCNARAPAPSRGGADRRGRGARGAVGPGGWRAVPRPGPEWLGIWILALAASGLGGCSSSPKAGLWLEDRPGYGTDRVVGVLRVEGAEAYLQEGEMRITLIQEPPQTGTDHDALSASTARALRNLDGRRVRAQGDLRGTTLWEARVTLVQ